MKTAHREPAMARFLVLLVAMAIVAFATFSLLCLIEAL
jgi:hypothetical protein